MKTLALAAVLLALPARAWAGDEPILDLQLREPGTAAIVIPPDALPQAAPSWGPVSAFEVAGLGVAIGLIWTDVLFTRQMFHGPYGQYKRELNPALGSKPSDSTLIFVGGVLPTIGLTALWRVLPTRWRNVPVLGVIGGEGLVVAMHSTGF